MLIKAEAQQHILSEQERQRIKTGSSSTSSPLVTHGLFVPPAAYSQPWLLPQLPQHTAAAINTDDRFNQMMDNLPSVPPSGDPTPVYVRGADPQPQPQPQRPSALLIPGGY